MAGRTEHRKSFSAGRRWAIFLSVMVSIAAMVALGGMLNYLGSRHFTRMTWAKRDRPPLSQQTIGLLKSITNDVKVILYFDKGLQKTLYDECRDLLAEYQLRNPRISVQTVDYQREPGEALKIKNQYKLESADARDLVIFECNENRSIVQGSRLWEKGPYRQVIDGGTTNWDQDIRGFRGEAFFTTALVMTTNPKMKVACYLQDHGEHVLDSRDDDGYYNFKNVLASKNILTTVIHLNGTNNVPANCDMLVIARPRLPIPPEELNKVQQYLAQGGRLLALHNGYAPTNTGLERLLAAWGIEIGPATLRDPENTDKGVMILRNFNASHPVSRPLQGSRIGIVYPRPLLLSQAGKSNPDEFRINGLAWTGPKAELDNGMIPGVPVPVIVTVEKDNSMSGPTRIVAAGDSLFLGNTILDAELWQNDEFAGFAANWLVDQPALMEGIMPRPLTDYNLSLTQADLTRVSWIFLVAMPGGILLLGGLVWLRRRR